MHQGKYTDNLFLVCFLSNKETSLKIAEYIFVLFIKLLSLPRFPRRYFRKEVREVGNIHMCIQVSLYISAWASALLVQTGLGNAKAL